MGTHDGHVLIYENDGEFKSHKRFRRSAIRPSHDGGGDALLLPRGVCIYIVVLIVSDLVINKAEVFVILYGGIW